MFQGGYFNGGPTTLMQPGPANRPPPPPGTAIQWMQKPTPIPGVPPGLEYLTQINKLVVTEQANLFQMFIGIDMANRYIITNSAGQPVYTALENSDLCSRQCCGPRRGFLLHIYDNLNDEVMRIRRDFKCCGGHPWCAGCCDACAQEIHIEAPPGNPVGYVKEKGSFIKPIYEVLDENRNPVLKVIGPTCIFVNYPCDNQFKITQLNDESAVIGEIRNQWNFLTIFTHADTFGIEFPMDLAVKTKAALMGALFLIDFMFFEAQKENGNRNRQVF